MRQERYRLWINILEKKFWVLYPIKKAMVEVTQKNILSSAVNSNLL